MYGDNMTKFSIKTKKWLKYMTIASIAPVLAIGIVYPELTFPAFLTGWLFLIPAAVGGFLIYGLREYMKERKNVIIISVKKDSALERFEELVRQEAEIKKEKRVLYEELTNKKLIR